MKFSSQRYRSGILTASTTEKLLFISLLCTAALVGAMQWSSSRGLATSISGATGLCLESSVASTDSTAAPAFQPGH